MRLPFILLILCTALTCFTACSDDEAVWMEEPTHTLPPQTATRAAHYTSSLVQEGKYWKATQRVPLVGRGRIVDNYANALVSALSVNSHLGHLVDEDLTNCASFGGGLLKADVLAGRIVSVRDMHRTYAGGQKIGFMFKVDNSSLLTLEVLKSFWIQTYKNGVAVEKFGNTEGTKVLELDLISVAKNDDIKEFSVTATQPFDEIEFNVSGISADLLKSLSIYYAFVGENEIKTATAGSNCFPDAHLHKGFLWTNILNSEHIIDNELTNYAYYGTLSGLLGEPCATVDFGQEVPAGSEVGFEISQVDILNLSALCDISLETYDADDNLVDKQKFGNLLSLSLIKVGNKSRVSMITTKPCTQVYIVFRGLEVKLGGTDVFFAYARDAVTVDISSRFSASDVTISSNSYTLPVGVEGSTTWQVISAPEKTNPVIKTFKNDKGQKVTKIVGMSKNGYYRLQGVFTPNKTPEVDNPRPTIIEFVIHRDALTVGDKCNQMLGTAAEAEIADIKGGGSLVSFGSFKNPENLIDDDPFNYAQLVGVLSIAKNVGIGAIHFKKPINPDKQPIRVGFTIQNTFDFLGVDLLSFFQIRLYNGDQRVDDNIVDMSTVGDVSLIGSKGNKVRMGIKTSKTFDQIELWTVGVLNLKVQRFRIYNVFWESQEADCPSGDIEEACVEMLTSAQGAEINYQASNLHQAISAGATIKDLGNLLDEDKNSYATCEFIADVAGGAVIAVKFPPLKTGRKPDGSNTGGGSMVGFIVEDPTQLADVNLLDFIQMQVFSYGAQATDVLEGDFLDLDVLGHTGRALIETRVTNVEEFNELRLYIQGGAKVLTKYKIFGAFIRRDTNGDGIPDCAEDEENPKDPVDMLNKAEIKNPHICWDESLTIDVTGAKPEDTYTLVCWNTSQNNEITEFQQQVMVGSDGRQTFVLKGLKAGEYFIRIKKGNDVVYASALEAYVHPQNTTWKKNAQSTDWNSWSNWTDGAPWTCTNVILPTGCVRYPELQDFRNNNDPNIKNYCANLHIESHAELVNSHLLDQYDYVWMELTLVSGKNYILSSPLTNTVTGDYFIPAKWEGDHSKERKFDKLSSTNSPENRFAPRLYQRCWSRDVPGKVITDGEQGITVITSETDWTAPFNAVAEPITLGMGWMVRAEDEGLPVNKLTFRFPKTHGEYHYFDATGANTGIHDPVDRTKSPIGHFAVKEVPFDVTVSNYRAGSTFVVGNPFAAHLNIAKFLEKNQGVISEVKLTNGNGTYTVLYRAGEITTTSPGFTHIAPMQGFYVTAKSKAQQLTVHFTADMQEQKPGYNIYANGDIQPAQKPKSARTRSAAGDQGDLRILAVSGGKSTQCVVKLRPDSHLNFYSGEDSRLLYDGENPPTVAVFTVAGGVAADIQQVPASEAQHIDVGWRMEQARNLTLHLSHEAGSEWSHWVLENRQTRQRIALSQPETVVQLGQQSTRVGGWRLVRE